MLMYNKIVVMTRDLYVRIQETHNCINLITFYYQVNNTILYNELKNKTSKNT